MSRSSKKYEEESKDVGGKPEEVDSTDPRSPSSKLGCKTFPTSPHESTTLTVEQRAKMRIFLASKKLSQQQKAPSK